MNAADAQRIEIMAKKSWTMSQIKRGVRLMKSGTSRFEASKKTGVPSSTLYYYCFPNRRKADAERAQKRDAKKNGKGRKTKKTASKKSEAPVTLTATIKREIREQIQRSASALASLIAAQTA